MEQPSHWTFPISLYGHITVQFLEKWFPFNLTLCHTVQLEPLIINTATLSLLSDEASNLILAGCVYWWASDPGHLSLSGHCCWLSSLSLLILSLSLCHFSEVILTATNKTKPLCQQILFHSCWFSLSLSICHSLSLYFSFLLSLWSDSKSHWTTTPCSQALGASTSSITFPLCHKGLPRILSYCVLQVTKQITE